MTAEAVIKSSPRWQGLTVTGKQIDADNTPEPGRPIIINCHGHTEVGLCEDCAGSFRGVLHDLPMLLDDLDIAISGWARFVERGARPDTDAVTAGLNPAVKAQQRLEAALAGAADWFDAKAPWFIAAALATHLHHLAGEPQMPQLARDISQAASRAHHVIDAPKDFVYYGPCPDCGRDIVQERIHKDDDTAQVTCRYPSCNYAKTLDLHYKRIIETNMDRHFSVTECVSMITKAGEPITRDQINGWIRHKGFPREWTERPTWKGADSDEIVMVGMWTVKLRDVLEFMDKKNQQKSSA